MFSKDGPFLAELVIHIVTRQSVHLQSDCRSKWQHSFNNNFLLIYKVYVYGNDGRA